MEKIKVDIKTPKTIFGNENFTVIVEITNLLDEPIDSLSIDELVFPGTKATLKEHPNYSELDILTEQKNAIVREMEAQVAKAYERQRIRNMSGMTKFLHLYSYFMSALFTPVFSAKTTGTIVELPYWAKEACRILDWDDVIRLEKDIIDNENENSFLKNMFLINKDKLRRCLETIAAKNHTGSIVKIDLEDSFSVNSGETIAFPYKYKAPTLLKSKEFDLQYKISFKDKEKTSSNQSAGEIVQINASPFTIPLGAFVGALAGYTIRAISQLDFSLSPKFWYNLFGSVLLAIIFAFLTKKSPTSEKIITVEDFVGGIVSGAIAGLFSETLIEKISTLFFS